VLRKRKRPALVIWGDTDPFIPVYVAYEQQDAFPGARVELVHAGHFPFVELVDEVDTLVAPFWKENVRVVKWRH
jgi:pimeloyl-ACP methyl ester carboxylesterase